MEVGGYVLEWGGNMFMGEHLHSLDSKGRMIIPAGFRDMLGKKFVATRGLDRCIFVYPRDEWHILEDKLKSLPLTKKDARAFVRFFFSGACECDFDRQGRISLPSNLREYAELEKEVVVIGVSNRLELWSKKSWDHYMEEAINKDQELAETIEELGI